jgi:hypothetical protein
MVNAPRHVEEESGLTSEPNELQQLMGVKHVMVLRLLRKTAMMNNAQVSHTILLKDAFHL